MPLLSRYARGKKIKYFAAGIDYQAMILEVGCADGWLGAYFRARDYINYVGLDLTDPADIVGDIRNWQDIGIEKESFDVIIAFEVVEHVHCWQEFYDVLKPGGLLMLTSPVPHMDWLCRILELVGLSQKRTSRHDHLVYFRDIPLFEPIEIKTVGFMAQWGKFRKPMCQDNHQAPTL